MTQVALGCGILLCAAFASSLASAENQARIEGLKIEVDFDACTTEQTQKTEFCANEKWNIEVDADGWSAEGTGTDGAPPVLEMQAICQDGKYKSVTNSQIWLAKCELTGDAVNPCFHIIGGGSREAFTKVDTRQCFNIAESACTMTLEGMMIGQAEAVKGEYAVVLKELKSCRIVK
ncbi:hypothetical protein [Dongia deserti]|uniref:hypothetical protein n=1 Tax=Dongia deserti TaxID=2268030 RepID=UPI0025491493|nr:hypothetical protein [Dongia deserti]